MNMINQRVENKMPYQQKQNGQQNNQKLLGKAKPPPPLNQEQLQSQLNELNQKIIINKETESLQNLENDQLISTLRDQIEGENIKWHELNIDLKTLQIELDGLLLQFKDQDNLALELQQNYTEQSEQLKCCQSKQTLIQLETQQLAEELQYLDQEIIEISDILQLESELELQYYRSEVLEKEIKNIQARRGPYIIGIISSAANNGDQNIACNLKNFDRILDDSQSLLDSFPDSFSYMSNMIFDSYLNPDQLIRFKNASFILISDSLFGHFFQKIEQRGIKQNKCLENEYISIYQIHPAEGIKIQIANLTGYNDDPEKVVQTLRKLRQFGYLIQNDQEEYIINRKLNEICKGCEETRKIMQLVSHKEQILIIMDINQIASADQQSLDNSYCSQNKELQSVINLFRKIKFFNY
ncbi:UNKNOWN [Stylonychia lemnae]|uniref:Uncharacterized protein n=1 Tax=Stylonychia lemnae TaxID=5949 RepID=A0A078BAY2_STYLE|nr:UNKNOWN [Stylonychia lemnae]|eukprot:CDW91730.1 UNKNOWN [Stylonychia lemnae]